MQLFITEFTQDWNQITLDNKEILHQTRKVLRMKIWDKFFIQQKNTRHEIEILNREKNTIKGKIINTENNSWDEKSKSWILIAIPNKWSKLELIVQKLSEIWIKNIYLWPSERSIIKEANEKKIDRLNKIAKEAVEQSRWRELPKIEFIKDISKIISDKKIIIFDKQEKKSPLIRGIKGDKKIIWIIGPEGWLTKNDYQKFWDNYEIKSLWDTILRTETASIIVGRAIKNLE